MYDGRDIRKEKIMGNGEHLIIIYQLDANLLIEISESIA